MEQGAGPAENPGERGRQPLEGCGLLQEDVEARVGAEAEREREAPAMVPASAPRGGDGAHLGGDDPEAPAVEGAAEADGDGRAAIPAELDDRGLEAGQREGEV